MSAMILEPKQPDPEGLTVEQAINLLGSALVDLEQQVALIGSALAEALTELHIKGVLDNPEDKPEGGTGFESPADEVTDKLVTAMVSGKGAPE